MQYAGQYGVEATIKILYSEYIPKACPWGENYGLCSCVYSLLHVAGCKMYCKLPNAAYSQ